MKLYLVRHGQTDYNKARRLQGILDIPLNDYGRYLAKITKVGYDENNIRFDVAYSSDLSRAYETADILCDGKLDIIKDTRLREIKFGHFEGFQLDNISIDGPKDIALYNCIYDCENYIPDDDAESFDELYKRTADFLEMLRSTYKNGETILAATHGGCLKGFLHNLLGIETKDFWNSHHKNLANVIVSWENDGPFVVEEIEKYFFDKDKEFK